MHLDFIVERRVYMEDLRALNYLNAKGIKFDIKTFPEATEKGNINIAKALGVRPLLVVKTLVLKGSSRKFYVCLIGGDSKLDFDSLKGLAKESDIKMASPEEIYEQTGYQIGSISPFGLKNELAIFADKMLEGEDELYIGAGKFGYEVVISPGMVKQAVSLTFSKLSK